MKESDIVPKVVELAKEVAKYWKMEIYEGCWVKMVDGLLLVKEKQNIKNLKQEKKRKESWHQWFPIPSISDCLEKLREYANENITIFIDTSMIWFVTLDMYTQKKKTNQSKSLHEALLSALLAALKEEK